MVDLRPSYKRNLIFRALQRCNGGQPTAEEIYLVVKEEGAHIGLSTIYRNLKMLEQLNLVEKKKIGTGPARYYLTSSPGNK